MIRTKLFKVAFFMLFLVGVLSTIGVALHLFDEFWWYDIILHTLSGGVVALTVFILWNQFSPATMPSRGTMILIATLTALTVGIIWECYELYFGITFLADGRAYFLDTAKDITDDILGGYLGSLYSVYILKKSQPLQASSSRMTN